MSNALSVIASSTGVSQEEITNVLKGMIISGKNQHGAVATDAELVIASSICAKYDLNPMAKEIAIFTTGGRLQVTIPIDGWIKILNRDENFDGVEFNYIYKQDGEINAIETVIHMKHRKHPAKVMEFMDECVAMGGPTWKKCPARMLRNKSLGQCVRVACGVTDVIDNDEASRITGNSQPIKDAKPQPESEPVDLNELRQSMLAAKDNNELREISGSIRQELEASGQWARHKADIVLMNREVAEVIESRYTQGADEVVVEFDADTGEVIDGQ